MPPHSSFALRQAGYFALLCATLAAPASQAGDWATWRGPNLNGIAAAGQSPPVNWNESENIIWKTPVPGRGHSSPTIVGERIFLTTADESSQTQGVVAFDRRTGKQLWTTPISKGGFPETHRKNTHATPSVASDGQRLFVSFHHHAGIQVSALSLDGDLVFASGGYPKSETVCLRARDGRLVWRNDQKCYEQSMLAADGYLYAVTDRGIAYCWRGADGREMWSSRLAGGAVSASPILAGGNIYLANERGTVYVFKAQQSRFELVARNQLGQEAFATPAICDNRIYMRVAANSGSGRQETLYCIGTN